MGNLFCSGPESAHLAAVARDFCPFPDYSPGPLYNVLTANSSQPLSEHYAAVQASLTPQQQQDFTRTLRSTFGKEGKVSYGGVGVVALSLAVLFDTVARQVKGEYVSDQEPIPGLFHTNPTGTYPPPVYIVSRYLRLVPYIANNPTRMADETQRCLEELNRAIVLENDAMLTAQQVDTMTIVNSKRSEKIGRHILEHLRTTFNKNVDLNNFGENTDRVKEVIFHFNCDPKVASEGLMDSLGTKTFESCDPKQWDGEAMKIVAFLETFWNVAARERMPEREARDFDLKANALGKWI